MSLNLIAKVSGLKRIPPQSPHSTFTSERKFISIRRYPCPLHDEQDPSFLLKENREEPKPRNLANSVEENISLIIFQIPT